MAITLISFASKDDMSKINHILRRLEQEKRERAERERREAEARRRAAIEEQSFKSALGCAIEHGFEFRGRPDHEYVRPHPNDAGRKPVRSPAGEAAENGRKQFVRLPGSFETGDK
jgi:hypothetical protein